jgi:hypothetical protein
MHGCAARAKHEIHAAFHRAANVSDRHLIIAVVKHIYGRLDVIGLLLL